MSWALKIPYRSDTATLDEVIADCAHIADPDERAVAVEFIETAGAITGIQTAQQLKWLAQDLGGQRRSVHDALRARVGLKSTAEIEARDRARQRYLSAAYPKNYEWDPMTGATSTIGQAEADAAQARSREVVRQARLDERAADAERHRPTEIHADNLPR